MTAELTPFDAEVPAEIAVSSYLEQARSWLSTAVELTGPAEIARAKAEIATAAEATKQLGLSKDIQLDAQEMVRRAEYALGKAIRKGQADGAVRPHGATLIPGGPAGGQPRPSSSLPSPKDFFGTTTEYEDANAMRELDPEEFDDALDEARAEGNLSRANVVRKTREIRGCTPSTPRRKALPDAARDAGWDLRKAVERVERIADDDRFTAHKTQVAPHLRSHLQHAIDVCHDLLDRLNEKGNPNE